MKKLYTIGIILLSAFLFIANSSQHPTNPNGGYTGAPLDGICLECHTNQNNNLSGSFDIQGLPDIAIKNETYLLRIKVSNPENDAVRAGFQMVALEEDLSNAGVFDIETENAIIKVAKGRTYVGHSPAINFDGNRIAMWLASWSPGESDEGTVTLYGAGMIGSGTEGNKRDRAIFRQWQTIVKSREEAVDVEVELAQLLSCKDSSDASLSLITYGGVAPLSFKWNQEIDSLNLNNLPAGIYAVTVTDSIGNSDVDSIQIFAPEPLVINEIEIEDASNATNADGKISINIQGGNEPYLIEWKSSTSDSIINRGMTLDSIGSGSYIGIITDASGCQVFTDTLMVLFNSSLTDSYGNNIIVYPNPTSSKITIQGIEKFKFLYLMDVNGKTVLKKEITASSEVLTPNLPQGIYFLGLQHSNKATIIKKIIVK